MDERFAWVARSGRSRRIAAFGMAGLLICCGTAATAQPAGPGEYRDADVAGWYLTQPPAESSEPFVEATGPTMTRRTADYMIEYEIRAGIHRVVGVQRLSCGEATDANGGVIYHESIFTPVLGGEAAGAVRAAARRADASYDEACPARPAALDAALSGLETALDTLEGWVRERPLPAAAAWSRGYWAVERSEPPVAIRYSRDPGGEAVRYLEVETSCDENSFSEREELPPPARPEDRVRAAAALAHLLARANAQCPLAPGQRARLAEGFEEALALAAAEEAEEEQ